MSKIRVLQLMGGFDAGGHFGGAEVFAMQLARHLDRGRFEIEVWGMRDDHGRYADRWRQRLRDAGLPHGGLTAPEEARLARQLARLLLVVDRFRPHIIHSHTERADSLNLMAHLLHRSQPAAVRTIHTEEQWQSHRVIGPLLNGLVFPATFAVEAAISQHVKAMFDRRPLARLLGRRSPACYNSIDPEELLAKAEGPPPPEVRESGPRLAIVGRLTEQKGHRDAFQALALLRKTLPAELYVIGGGELEAELRALAASLGIAAAVHFLGVREDVPLLMRHMDLFVSSSLWEGFPTVLLEAMVLGLPVVATDVSGSRELIVPGRTGYLAPPGQPAALAAEIARALGDPEVRRALAAQAREHAGAYTISASAAQYEQLYQAAARRA